MVKKITIRVPTGDEDIDRIKKLHEPMVTALFNWYSLACRPLPWRKEYEPYCVWISEVMLQQTQMERGVAYYNRWMQRFPTLQNVAEASQDDVLKMWEGLGYYSRARKLHETAKILIQKYKGVFPEDVETLRLLPGIGEYTAGAIASIAFNKAVPAVDANVERVFSRIFDIAAPSKSTVAAGFIRQMIEAIMPQGRAREFNQAVMELGALICKKKAFCEECPLKGHCQANRLNLVAERPVLGKKIKYSSLQVVTGVLLHDGQFFIQKRLNSGMWAGLWEFPGGRLEPDETPEQGVVRELAEETNFTVKILEPLGVVQHAYTRYRVTLHCILCCLKSNTEKESPVPLLTAATEFRWVYPDELDKYTFPAGHRKLLDRYADRLRMMARLKS